MQTVHTSNYNNYILRVGKFEDGDYISFVAYQSSGEEVYCSDYFKSEAEALEDGKTWINNRNVINALNRSRR